MVGEKINSLNALQSPIETTSGASNGFWIIFAWVPICWCGVSMWTVSVVLEGLGCGTVMPGLGSLPGQDPAAWGRVSPCWQQECVWHVWVVGGKSGSFDETPGVAERGLIGREEASVLKGKLGRRESANQAMNAKLQAGVHQGGRVGRGGQERERKLFSEMKKTLATPVGIYWWHQD